MRARDGNGVYLDHLCRPNDYPFSKFANFRFTLQQIPFDSQFLPVSLPFSHVSHQNNACFI